jgi:hypothetical protein
VPALLQFQVREAVEEGEGLEISLFGLFHYGIELSCHAFEAQGGQLVLESVELGQRVFLLLTKAS